MTVKTNSKTIREKKAAREAKDGRSPRHKLLDETLSKVGKPLTATIGERIPKQLHIPGTAPKVHKDIESKGDAYQEALARKRTSDTRVEEAKALLIATMKERKVSTYRYQDVELVLKVGSDQIKVRELDKERNV